MGSPLDLKSAFIKVCDIFHSDELQRNWLIYVEEERNRIIIERVTSPFFDVIKEEPNIDSGLFEPQISPDQIIGDGLWAHSVEVERNHEESCEAPEIRIDTLDSGGESLGEDENDEPATWLTSPVKDEEALSAKPRTRSSTNKNKSYILKDGKYICLLCGDSYPSPKVVRKHIQSHSKSFPCSMCKKNFKQKDSLKKHFFLEHPEETWDEKIIRLAPAQRKKQERKVKKINETSSKASEDDKETAVASEDEEDDEEDEDDEEGFLDENSGALVPIGDGVKKRETCPFCDKSLSCSRALKRHIASKHLGQGKIFSCPVCNKDYKCQTKMREHLHREHPHSSHANKRYPCPMCGKEFKASLKMKEHLNRMHSKATKTCSICNKVSDKKNTIKYCEPTLMCLTHCSSDW